MEDNVKKIYTAVYITSTLLFIIYLCFLLHITIFSDQVLRRFPDYTPQKKYNISILGMLKHGGPNYIFRNFFGNIILFMPFGFFLPIVSNPRFIKLSIRRFVLCCLFGILASITIENVQHYFAYRIYDIDDIILNSIGFVVGCAILYACFYFVVKRIPTLRRKLSND